MKSTDHKDNEYYIKFYWAEAGYNGDDSEMCVEGICSADYYEKHKNDDFWCYQGPYTLIKE